MSWLRFAPLLVLAILIALLAAALLGPNTEVQSNRLVGQPVPAFELAPLSGNESFTRDSLLGEVYMLNVWGSWCPPCEVEHPFLMELAAEGVPIYGIAWRDSDENARDFLNRLGNPFQSVVLDPRGQAIVALGVTGAPETFVVDGDGIIRARWAGPITPQVLDRVIYPALEAAGN